MLLTSKLFVGQRMINSFVLGKLSLTLKLGGLLVFNPILVIKSRIVLESGTGQFVAREVSFLWKPSVTKGEIRPGKQTKSQ